MQQIDINHMIQELMDMHKLLYPKSTKASSAFVLARLLPHMDAKAWAELGNAALHKGWCTFKLDNNIPTIQTPAPITTGVNIQDNLTESLLKADFTQHLEAEVARSMRASSPIALIHFAYNDSKSLKDAAQALQNAVYEYGCPCDIVGAISKKRLGLILPGAKIFKAQNVVEDIIEFCAQEGFALKAGIAHGVDKVCSSTFMEQADLALQDAIKKGQDVHIFKKNEASIDATLVQSHEKRFLFGGS